MTPRTSAGRKVNAATWLFSLGLTGGIARLPHRPCLIVLTYHRIGYAQDAAFDPDVYSATPEQFEDHVTYLRARFPVLRLGDAVDWMTGGCRRAEAAILLTFDDGYIDNYEIAAPILRKHGVPATFFLPTAFIGTPRIPWWDELAWYVRNSMKEVISVTHPRVQRFAVDGANRWASLGALLRLYKSPLTADPQRLLAQVAESSGAPPPPHRRMFMNWAEARELAAHGIDFGSHSHSHEILSRLTRDEQEREMRQSRDLLEQHLGVCVDTMAYPVGGRDAYNSDSFAALEAAGYAAAFSHDKSDVNRPGEVFRYNILRLSVGLDTPLQLMALRVGTAAVAGRLVI
jgi:peptidoglycan/xylan/chitin deacetylase (PgdA/CDA1 family)